MTIRLMVQDNVGFAALVLPVTSDPLFSVTLILFKILHKVKSVHSKTLS